jgi:hypothetical protein
MLVSSEVVLSLDPAIHAYVAAACGHLDRVIAGTPLTEPVVRDYDPVAHTLDRLIETLAGLALGSVVGEVVSGLRRGIDVATFSRVERTMLRVLADVRPRAAAPVYGLDHTPVRTLVFELQHRLRRRLALASGDARALVALIASAVIDAAPEQASAVVQVLARASADSIIAERYRARLEAGWRCATAIIEGKPDAIGDDRMWRLWMARVGGVHELAAPLSPVDLAAEGYVMRIG